MFFIKKKFLLTIACKANITRSAYFAAYLRNLVNKNYPYLKKRIEIKSFGIDAKQGSPAHEVTKLVAQLNGFSLNNHQSSIYTKSIMKKSNVILVMENWQKEKLINEYPQASDKIFLIMEYLWHGSSLDKKEIPDPTGKNFEEYNEFIKVAHAESERILHELSREEIL